MERLFLQARSGRQCVLASRFKVLAEEEKETLTRRGLKVMGIWAGGWWRKGGLPYTCTPTVSFWDDHPWAGKEVQRAGARPVCEGCGCFAPWYFCVLTRAPVQAMREAGYGPLPPLPRRDAPPENPWSEDLVCKMDKDCVFAYPAPCQSPTCGSDWQEVSNRAAYQAAKARWAKVHPACKPCVQCFTSWLGTRAVCVDGQCEVRP